jgi:hypothetical protein
MKKTFLNTLIGILGLSLLPLTHAFAASAYQVEILIFKYINPQGAQSEIWPKDPALPHTYQATNLQPALAHTAKAPATTTQTFTDSHPLRESGDQATPSTTEAANNQSYHYLPVSSFKLTPEEKILANRGNYRVLLHSAWLQKNGQAPLIHVFGGAVYDSQGRLIEATTDRYQPLALVSNTTAPQWELDGTVQVSAEQYYKVNTALALTTPAPPAKAAWFGSQETNPTFSRYVLRQIQRMKSDELHYFDHPMFGMLVKVTAVENS